VPTARRRYYGNPRKTTGVGCAGPHLVGGIISVDPATPGGACGRFVEEAWDGELLHRRSQPP
jgi:hypothetical protein